MGSQGAYYYVAVAGLIMVTIICVTCVTDIPIIIIYVSSITCVVQVADIATDFFCRVGSRDLGYSVQGQNLSSPDISAFQTLDIGKDKTFFHVFFGFHSSIVYSLSCRFSFLLLSSDLLYYFLPIVSLSHLYFHHSMNHTFEPSSIHLPKPLNSFFQLTRAHSCAIFLVAPVLSLQQSSLEHDHSCSEDVGFERIADSFVDVLLIEKFALLGRKIDIFYVAVVV